MFCSKTNNKILLVLTIGFCLLLTACSNTEQHSNLYNIDSLISKQVKYLAEQNARLSKRAVLNGVKEDSTFVPKDSAAWNRELEIFRQLREINKPVNAGRYLVDDNLYDVSSNLTVKAFSATEELPIEYVRVFYQESMASPRKIVAQFNEESSLYKSGRILTMEFGQIDGVSVLTSYTVEGGQKMMMGDSVAFSLEGKIVID